MLAGWFLPHVVEAQSNPVQVGVHDGLVVTAKQTNEKLNIDGLLNESKV
jgi:hypothetical protein